MKRLRCRIAPQVLFLTCVGATLFLISFSLPGGRLLADEAKVDFNQDIRPLLSNRCLICHGPDAATREADLRLDSLASASEDRGGYQALAPGKPNESDLLRRVMTEGDDRMPPEGSGERLSKKEIDLLRRWIEQGAPFAKHWSYEPPRRSPPPKAQDDGGQHAIDRFVIAKLRAAGLDLGPEADRFTLIRRLSLDLTGAPPTLEEVDRFVNDSDPSAYENLVQRLLDSPRYGERWGAMWLDLARYADSAGYANDPPRTIWMYRDWVIKAFNENMPFDQFTIEQLAGDLLENPSEAQRIATAFHRNTLTNSEGGTNDEEFRNVAVVDRVNTTMQVWMGATIRCAQCHNHKYDPLSQEEYFSIFAFFNQTEDADRANEAPLLRVYSQTQKQQRADLQRRIAELKTKLSPTDDVLRQRVSQWERTYQAPVWRTLIPKTMSSTAKTTFTSDSQSAIQVRGERTDKDTYALEFEADGKPITAVRIEALPDAELPAQGPGRSDDGGFVLSELELSAGPKDGKSRSGRYVRIELPGQNKFLHLAEVQVFSGGDNVALKGKASQSSTGFDGPAKLAIDGNTNGLYAAKSVSHTAAGDKQPWLEVDLGAEKSVERVAIWNRTDNGTQSRLDGFVVSLLDAKRNVVWTQANPKAPKRELIASLNGFSRIDFVAASETFAQAKTGDSPYDSWHASAAIDRDAKGPQWGWSTGGQAGQSNAAAFVLGAPLENPAGSKITLLVKQNFGKGRLLGRFRVSVTSSPRPVFLLPNPASAALQVAADKRSDQQKSALLAFYRTIDKPSQALLNQIKDLEKKMAAMMPIATPVMVALSKEKRRTTKIQVRGNFMVTTDVVNERTPEVFHEYPPDAKKDRLGFARWLVDKRNPLTARVIANRYWEQLFGIGIVATSEEFGSQGDLPSHPGLLDHLALQFMDSNWDIKQLLKHIVTSRTYRQSSRASTELLKRDPENRLLARGPRFRLSAEMVRDQALAAAGLLSKKMYGPSVRPPRPKLGLKAAFGGSTDWETSPGEDRYRRAIYTSWRRSLPYPSMATFDAPTRNVCTIRRGRTNTPLQALVTMNDPAYVEAAQALARRMASRQGTDLQRAAFGFRVCTSRPPSDAEVEKLASLLAKAEAIFAAKPEEAKQLATEPLGPLEGPLIAVGHGKMAAWTTVANVLLNLDEVLVKQ